MPLPPIIPKLGGGLAGISNSPWANPPVQGRIPSAVGMGPSIPGVGPAPQSVPAAGMMKTLPGTIATPPASPTQGPPQGLASLAPQPTAPPQGLVPPLAPPPQGLPPAAPTMLQPDASGVTPPPGTPQPMAAAPPPASPVIAEASPAPTGRQQGIEQTAPAGATAPAAQTAETPPAEGAYDYEGHDKKGPPDGFFDNPTYSSWLNDQGLISWLPDVNDLQSFFAAAGLADNPKLQDKFRDLSVAMENIRQVMADPSDPDYSKKLGTATNRINNLTDFLAGRGWHFDLNSLIQGGTPPPGTPATPGPTTPGNLGGGVNGPPAGGGLLGPGAGGSAGGGPGTFGQPGGGGQDVNLGSINPDSPIPDWLKTADPATSKAWLDYLGYQQSRDDRQLAIDAYGGLADLYANDPTRKAAYDYLDKGPNYTLDAATVDRMKTQGRTQAGYGLSSLDQSLREAAAQAGVPTGTLSALAASGRTDILNNLLGQNRQLDIQAALQRGQDEQQYMNNLFNAQGTLVGPQASYYGGLAGLISGSPGLAQTGNPLSGLAEYRAYQDYINQGPSKLDRLGAYVGIGGQVLGGLGRLASGVGAM